MKNKVIKLARRLGNFTIEDIQPILQADTDVIKSLLDEILRENILFFRNGLYFYQSTQVSDSVMKCRNKFMQHSKNTIELLLRGFCAEIVSEKMNLIITNLSLAAIGKYYGDFRKNIYEEQENELKKYNDKNPQNAWKREFFGKTYYFYFYNNKIYVSTKKLKEPKERVLHSKREAAHFKTVYSYLTRKVWHRQCTKNAHWFLADAIWRKDKTFEELLQYLFNLFYS